MEFPKVGDIFKQVNYRPDILGFDTFYTVEVVAIFDPRELGAEEIGTEWEYEDSDVLFVNKITDADSIRYESCRLHTMLAVYMKDYDSQKEEIIKRYEKNLKNARSDFYDAQVALEKEENAYNTIMNNSGENV